ncbi:MAG: DEAD/DEAH box helicase [Planctomycetes bacterium]|nr:DEAD/DEAH box helicase [Planctomycetota bacterium]
MRVVEGKAADEFSRLANPGRPLALAITKLTGIKDADLRRQPPSRAVLADFLRFVGDDPVVAHNASFDAGFLREKSGGYFGNTVIDTLELCRILYPALEHHDLDTMVETLGLTAKERHRALDDARLLVGLWGRLLARLDELPFDVVAALSAISALTTWPARHLFLEAEAKRLTGAFDVGAPEYRKLLRDFSGAVKQAQDARNKHDPGKRPPPKRLDIPQLRALLGQGGPFSSKLPAYELRPQQVRMTELVAQAFNEGQHLLVEAGTGVGKSIAYLVPAIHWARANGDKIVVSTNTKNLQEQLFFKDIPLLAQVLGVAFQAALIKGRANYLCARKLLYLIEEAERELSEEERVAFLAALVWAAGTETGDVAEATGLLGFRQAELWPKLCASGEECAGPNCRERRFCFLNHARALSMLADIVVANHAVVFAELDMESAVLPPYAHVVFDEAHNLEDAATEFLGREIDRWEVARLLRRLLRREKNAPDRGILPGIRYRMKKGHEREISEKEQKIERLLLETHGDVEEAQSRLDAFLQAIEMVFMATSKSGEAVRYEAKKRDAKLWERVEVEKKAAVSVVGGLRQRLRDLADGLDALEGRDFPHRSESICDLGGVEARLAEVQETLDFLVAGDDEGFVYWIEQVGRRRPAYRVAAAPIRVGPKLKELLYDRKDTIIFTSATLTAARSFQFLKDRIGLEQMEKGKLVAEDVGSPFDYDRQMRVLVPNFLPEPDAEEGAFSAHVSKLLIDIFRASGGRGLGLFTAYSMLNEAYPKLKAALESEGVLVLGQGFDGERRAITNIFKRDTTSVLLGTDSFWEGVDVPGESLSCLVIAKLPFAVHTAPVVQARCEEVEARGLSSFRNYTLPSAVIRFKQGVGRLIRTKTDFGVVVVLDRRLLTRNYGTSFLRSLPTGYRACVNPQHLCDMIRAFLGARGEDKRRVTRDA